MQKYNWIIEKIDPDASPLNWAMANKIKLDEVSIKPSPQDILTAIRARSMGTPRPKISDVAYLASLTEEDVISFRLSTTGLTIRKAKW